MQLNFRKYLIGGAIKLDTISWSTIQHIKWVGTQSEETPVKVGWKRLYADKESGENISIKYSQDDSFTAENLTISECETQPPKHFTESTLLKAMENIDRRIEDKELSEYVSERGLGTPATRRFPRSRIDVRQFDSSENMNL